MKTYDPGRLLFRRRFVHRADRARYFSVDRLDRNEVATMKAIHCALCWAVAALALAGDLLWTDRD